MDPREALLKYADDKQSDHMWVDAAYAKTQPKTLFDTGEIKH